MADSRPFAKIDTGYIMNPKWFQVRRAMQDAIPTAMPDALQAAVRVAREAHLASILYSAQNQTDGLFPVDAIKALCAIQTDLDEAAITALFDVGMWINHKGGMGEVKDYLKHQPTAQQNKKRSEAGRKGAEARWGNNNKTATTTNKKQTPKATRVKADWVPSPQVIDTLRTEYPDLDLRAEHQNFIDYWLARPGQAALKLDWDATWRIWMRKEGKELAKQRGRAPRRNQSQIIADNIASAQARDSGSVRALIQESQG